MTTRFAPSGLEYFNDPETSFFKQWFNNKHVHVPSMDSKEELYLFIFESLVYVTASDELSELFKMLPIPITSDRIKITNEITTYEIFCFFLSQLDIWLYEQKHPDRELIMNLTIEFLASLAGNAFNLNKDVLRNQIYNRIEHFPTLDNYEQIAEAMAHQVVWGIEKKKPSDTIPPETFNAISFEAALIAKCLMITIKHNLPALHKTWSNTLLRPACFKKTT